MPRKTINAKKSKTLEENGDDLKKNEKGYVEHVVEKGKPPIANGGKVEKNDSLSVDSKTSGTSSASIKKRFSFGKRKKNPDHLEDSKMTQDITGPNQNGDLRRSSSLNNFNQTGSRSKIPILRHKRQNGSKHDINSRLQKSGNYESHSLVLNPGMDSWRMAGLMDTVGKSNPNKTENSVNFISTYTCKPPNIALCSGSSKDTVSSLEKVTSAELSTSSHENLPVLNGKNEIKETLHNNNNNGFDTHNSSQLHDDQETEHLTDIVKNNTPGIRISDTDELVTAEASFNCENAPPCDGLDESEKMNDNTPDVVVLTESGITEPLSTTEVITEDVFCAGIRPKGSTSSDNECVTINIPSGNNKEPIQNETLNGEHTFVQELYELDDNNVISVRKLRDLIVESQIQMPKEVCCDDWLVLEFSHSAIISS